VSVDVSVVVPCYNGAARLPETLRHVALQDAPPGLRWEVVLVDNASTDGTDRVAARVWPSSAPAPLRVVREARLGLSHAHLRGFTEARGDIITWVEDDNWIARDWLAVIVEVMRQHPDVGASGGLNEAVCEVAPPAWFETFSFAYAVGRQGVPGDITAGRGYLWGAGLTVRKTAWDHLARHGFRPLLVDRQGTKLNSGGDTEICFALRLAGWRLWFEPRMRLRHFLPAHRLDWWYLRRLYQGFGASTVGFDPYVRALAGEPVDGRRVAWAHEAGRVLADLRRQARKVLRSWRHPYEGDGEVLTLESKLGRLAELLRKRGAYDRSLRAVWHAPWR